MRTYARREGAIRVFRVGAAIAGRNLLVGVGQQLIDQVGRTTAIFSQLVIEVLAFATNPRQGWTATPRSRCQNLFENQSSL